MASTCGSAAACCRNVCTRVRERVVRVVQEDVALADLGEHVRRRRALHLGQLARGRRDEPRELQRGAVQVGDEVAGRCGPAARAARRPRPRPPRARGSSRLRMRGLMPSAISSRTGGPKRRRSSSFSMALRRFSASSSSTSTSSLRVTRNVWCSCTSMPGNSCSRCSEMTSSTGTNDIGPALERGGLHVGGARAGRRRRPR